MRRADSCRDRTPLQPDTARIRALLEAHAEDETAAPPQLYCAQCGTMICTPLDRCEAGGQHHHLRTNPHGIRFEFDCYSHANVLLAGPLSGAHSWFSGYRWQLSECPGCRWHLGWRFQAEDGSEFYALISNRLRPAD